MESFPMQAFFAHQMDFIHFIYGLNFLLLAVTAYFVSRVKPQQKFWVWISLLGFFHGVSEWMTVVSLGFGEEHGIQVVKYIFRILSYGCFIEIVRQHIRQRFRIWASPIWHVGLVGLVVYWGFILDGLTGMDVLVRYMLGAFGGFAAAAVIARSFAATAAEQRQLQRTAWFMAAYAITHFIAPPSAVFPSMTLNQNSFMAMTGFPIQLLRMVLAMAAAWLLWQQYAFERAKIALGKQKMYRFRKDFLLPLSLVMVMGAGWVVTDILGRRMDVAKKDELMMIARLEASHLPVGNVAELTGTPADMTAPFYVQFKDELKSIMRHYPNAVYFYLFGDRDGQTIFLVDAENPLRPKRLEPEAVPGEVYEDDRDVLARLFKQGGREIIDAGDDKWGSFVTAYVPIEDHRAGKVLAVLGIDYDAFEWAQEIARFRLIAIGVTFIFVLLIVGFFVVYKREHESRRDLEAHQHKLLELSALLEKERASLETMFNSTQIGFLWLDEALRVRRINHVLANSFGYGPGAFQVGSLGKVCFLAPLRDLAQQVLMSGKGVSGQEQEYELALPGTAERLWLGIGADVLNIAGTRGILFSLVNITEHKKTAQELEIHRLSLEDIVRRRTEDLEKAKEKAEEANRLKSQFLFNVSHEIRTPLNGIVGFSELIAKSQNIERIHMMARTVLNEADILLALVNDVLDLGKLEEGKLAIFYAPTDLRQLMADVVKTVTIPANEKGLELRMELDQDVHLFVLADRLRICQVLLNLLNNAVKFTDEGSIVLKAQLLDRNVDEVRVRFAVVDTGIGIPSDKQHLIFERFSQVDGASTRKYGGAGLGTSIAKKIVELMGGSLGFISQPGVGSTFWCELSFTVCQASDMAAVEADEEDDGSLNAPAVTGSILVVEDYEINQDVMRAHLEHGGYPCAFASDGFVAVKACELKEYDLILMDIQMPGIDGYETARRIRMLGGWAASVPIIGVTANADDATRAACFASGMQDVVTKPIRRKPFLTMLRRWMAGEKTRAPEASGPAVAPSDAVVFDYAQAVAEFGDDKALVDTVMDKFFEQVKGQIQTIAQAILDKDGQAIGAQAHKIKGGASNLTAMKLAACARMMEEKGKANDLDGMEGIFEQLKQEVSVLEGAVAQARHIVSG